MAVGRGVLVAWLLMSQQAVAQTTRWAPPSPCVGDSAETHTRRGATVSVPNLDSMPMVRARATLAKFALRIDVRSVRMDGPAGVVIGQAPKAGTFASTGDVVIVCLRRPPEYPSVVGLPFDAARRTLVDAGYDGLKVNSFVDAASKVGIVIRQQPTAGTGAPYGSVDTLVVGMAPPIASVVRPLSPQTPEASPSSPVPSPAVAQAGAARPAVPTDTTAPMDLSWIWKVGVIGAVLSVAFLMASRAKDRRRLDSLRVTPYQHPGQREVVLTRRDRETRRTDD